MSRPIGNVYTLGYAAPGALEQLEAWMADPLTVLVDIRYAARSRWFPGWNKRRLKEAWGERYQHEPCLGNVNYRNRRKPIELADAAGGLAVVMDLLSAGKNVVLMCACVEEARCHRLVVAKLVVQARAAVEGRAADSNH